MIKTKRILAAILFFFLVGILYAQNAPSGSGESSPLEEGHPLCHTEYPDNKIGQI